MPSLLQGQHSALSKRDFNRKSLKILSFLILIVFLQIRSLAQNTLCNYEIALQEFLEDHPEMEQEMNTDEEILQTEMINNPQGIMNNEVYTIPIVFHVLHLGEPIGSGSNISNTQILQALEDLNNDFRNTNLTGYDVEIQFCLAQQDPYGNSQYDSNGNNITGIQRVDASSIPNFQSFGIWSGVNEIEAKALSNWPEADYVNVWIAHRLYTATGDAAGFAYFPSAGDDVDGIALRADATGTASNSKVITHEAGHFFTLHHTFRNGANDCPIGTSYDCHADGDMICETRAHAEFSNFPFPCDESLYTTCDPSFSYPYLVTENHMNYTDNSCRDEFVPEQAMRMRCALMNLRGSLLNSIGCMPGCEDVVAGFTVTNTQIMVNTNLTFTNISTNANSYNWTINGVEVGTATNLSYTFTSGGIFEVCLDAVGDDCVTRFCTNISVFPTCLPPPDSCELVTNGNFEQITGNAESGYSDAGFANVCGWDNGRSTSFYCNLHETNSVAVRVDYGYVGPTESIITHEELNLKIGKTYIVSFDYFAAVNSIDDIYLVLTDNPDGEYDIQNTTIVAHVENTQPTIQQQNNHSCYPPGTPFATYSGTFTYNGDGRRYLSLTAISPNVPHRSYVFFDNISINCCNGDICTPIPDFTYDTLCPMTFTGSNTGDGDTYLWTFLCDGYTATGPNVTRDFPAGTVCDICLTISCDYETSATVCKTIVIPEDEDCGASCTDIDVSAQACKKEKRSTNTYIANFDLEVPEGTGPCGDIPISSNSANAEVHVTSYSVADGSPGYDIISIGVEITTPIGYDLDSDVLGAGITLCDTLGNIICFNLKISGSSCDNCLGDITATAECIDSNPFDEEYVYEGSVTIDLPSDGFVPCNPVSTEVGYDQSVSIIGSQANIDFTINSSTEGDFDASSLLCFVDVDNIQYCYTLNIEIDPCPEPPECIDWGTKVADAKDCTVVDGSVTYTVDMSYIWLFGSGYSDCGHGLSAYLDGSSDISVTGGSIFNNGGYLSYSVSITMPCGFDTDQIYELVIVGCDSDGNPACFSFNIRFPDCDQDCDGRGDGRSLGGQFSGTFGENALQVYPNPSQHDITLSIKNPISKQHFVVILDHLGRKVVETKFASMGHIDVRDLQMGLYFIKVTDDRGNLTGFEKLIINK